MLYILILAALFFGGYGLIHLVFPILARLTASVRFGPGSQHYAWRNDDSRPELKKHYQMWALNEDNLAYFVGGAAALVYFLSIIDP